MKFLLRTADRTVAGSLGGALAAFLHALVVATLVTTAQSSFRERLVLVLAPELPLGALVGFVVAAAGAIFEPGIPADPFESVRRLGRLPMLQRTRVAALAPLLITVGFVWFVITANVARGGLSLEPASLAGRRIAWAAAVLAVLAVLVVLALLGPLRATLAAWAPRAPSVVNPARTGAVALIAVGVIATLSARCGGPGGDTFGPLGVLGVFTRPELDLSPVAYISAVGAAGYGAGAFVGRRIPGFGARGAALLVLAGLLLVAVRAELTFARRGSLAAALATGSMPFRLQLAASRRVFDRDHDGAASRFGGGDCDDANASIGPDVVDIPGNGIDEDCSGKDAQVGPARVVGGVGPTAEVRKIPFSERPWGRDVNLLVITIDTLRFDESTPPAGPSATPNLDALAARGARFTRAYSLASYTGKSIGPMMIGRYPSETDRDGGHFNRYGRGNVMVAERLKKLGFRTLGAAAMNYFSLRSGLARGFDVWDLSARPKHDEGGAGSDQDTSVTSPAVTDAAIRMLRKQADPQRGNFVWLHYTDPHAQYVERDGTPDFLGNRRGGGALARARYDAEVWATDREVGRLLQAIERLPSKRPWVVIVTSDHGEAFNEHGMSWHGMEVWESLVRVPLIIAAPGMTAQVIDRRRSHVDLVPTILDLAGGLDGFEGPGKSLVAEMLDGAAAPEREVLVDMPTGPYTQKRRALLYGPSPGMKVIAYPGKRFQLFDLARDPGELTDLSDDAPLFEEARSRLEAFETGLHEVAPTSDPALP